LLYKVVNAGVDVITDEKDEYPVVSGVPLTPNKILIVPVEFKETPFKARVTRFTQLGMLVKSMLVPDVEATAVAAINAPLLSNTPLVPLSCNGMIKLQL
jgi:uncharacterized protein YjfI (DUF2170 family)